MMLFPKLNIRFERWRYNKEYGLWVSNYGALKTEKKKIPVLPRPTSKSDNYPRIWAKGRAVAAHRVVAETWCKIPKKLRGREDLTIDHKDGNIYNWSAKNLQYMTEKENIDKGNSIAKTGTSCLVNTTIDDDFGVFSHNPYSEEEVIEELRRYGHEILNVRKKIAALKNSGCGEVRFGKRFKIMLSYAGKNAGKYCYYLRQKD